MTSRIALRIAASLLAASPLLLSAQSPAPTRSITLPLPGVHYRYWPEQLVQWVGPELPYSMIVLDVDSRGKQPIYDVELIGKSGNQVVHYTNSATELAIDQKSGFTVHQVAMSFDGPADPENGAQYSLRFLTETGTPVVWQFVLGTDVSGQGSGLSPVPAPIPVLMYREQGGLAGQGTALKIGGVTSVAAEWTEIAKPPFFVPYRGALSTGVQVLVFAPGSSRWKQHEQTLTNQENTAFKLGGNGNTVTMTDSLLGTTAVYQVDGSGVTRVTFGPEDGRKNDMVSLEFSPALITGTDSRFEIFAGKRNKIAGGAVQAAKTTPAIESDTWTFSSPDDLRGKRASAAASLEP